MHNMLKYCTNVPYVPHKRKSFQACCDSLIGVKRDYSINYKQMADQMNVFIQSSQKKNFSNFLGMGTPIGFMQQQPTLPFSVDKEYDLVVIGGGSGGLSCAIEARQRGLSVAIFDYVEPSPNTGTTWGLGGTCVNVGCIPKKLFHIAAQMKDNYEPAEDFGYQVPKEKVNHDWSVLRNNVQNYIKGINFSYKSKLSELDIDYINAKAVFKSPNSVKFTFAQNFFMNETREYELKGSSFVVATGGRPRCHPVAQELAITSDDLFSLEKDPGTTLVIGGGYIAVESAGFLRGLGKDVYMINRSSFLRTMDNDMAEKIVEELQDSGVKTFTQATLKSAMRNENGKITVDIQVKDKIKQIEVDTILSAIGRDIDYKGLGLDAIGVQIDEKSGKVKGSNEEKEQTNIENIYAIGDVLEGVPELQPVASKAGKLLAIRLAAKKSSDKEVSKILEQNQMEYDFIPTTVFSPTEYSYVGLSEEQALQMYPEEHVEVYHRETTPLQFSIHKSNTRLAYMKVITAKQSDGSELIVGMHFYGPAADEVIGGFALAMKLGLKKQDLDSTLGVHPSTSEDLFGLEVTKRSGAEFRKTDC